MKPPPTEDPYELLGVAATSSTSQIRAAYRDAIRRLHPDHRDGAEPDHAAFTALVDAWTLLGDAGTRAEFDAGRQPGAHLPLDTVPVTPPVLLDRRSSRLIRHAFVAAFVIVTLFAFTLFTVGMSQAGGR